MRSSRSHIVLSILLLCIALAAGWLLQRFSVAFDITANARHSLSPATVNVLQAIHTPVEIIAVLGPNPQQRNTVRTLIDRLQAIKPDIQLRFINPETNPAAARDIEAAPGGELILRTEGRERRLQTLSERNLTNSLRQLNREDDRNIAFITGHDERSPLSTGNSDWSTVASRLKRIGLVSREVSLVSEPRLDETIDLVVIAAPRRPYFPGELASLNDYLSRGGNVLWLTEGRSSTGTNLQLLADNLGVTTLPGTVIDTASQALAANSPDFVLLDQFPTHPITSILTNPIILPQASALAITPLAGQEVMPLLQSPAASWTEIGELSGTLAFDENTQEVAGPLLLGVTIERKIPEGTQRFAVIGDADFAASQFIDNGGNQSFTEALILWLSGDANAMKFVTQAAPDDTLSLSNRAIIVLSTVYLAGIPALLLILAGVIRWRRNIN